MSNPKPECKLGRPETGAFPEEGRVLFLPGTREEAGSSDQSWQGGQYIAKEKLSILGSVAWGLWT